MGREKLKPKLRFPEFEGEWEEKILSELLSFKNGINASKEDYGRGYKFINVLDIINNDYIIHEKILGSVNVSESEFQKNIVEYGDILFQRSSETREEVGQSNVYLDKGKPATFGGFVIRGKKIGQYDPFFLNKLLSTPNARKSITDKSGGSTRYNVGQDTLGAVKIFVASLAEQTRIATFLTAVDKRITLLTQKKEKLEQYKKGVMQKIFNQEIRFKDEKGREFPDWEEKRLGDLGVFVGGGTPESSKLDYWKGNIPWISSSDLIEDNIRSINITRFITGIAVKESATKIISKNSILIVSRVGIGKFAVANCDLCTSQDFTNIILKENACNAYFMCYYFNVQKNRFKCLSQGTSIKGFTGDDLRSLKFLIPKSITEQNHITTFLSALDKQIEKVDHQIVQMKQWKKGLLQKMFV